MKKFIIVVSFTLIFITGAFLYPGIVYASDKGIELDGYFDDWTDKPEAYLKYSNNPGQQHTVKWYVTDKYVYLYAKMGARGGQKFDNYVIQYRVNNGNQNVLHIQSDNPENGRVSVFNYSKSSSSLTNDGYVVRGSNSDGQTSDQAEYKIPLTVFQNDGSDNIYSVTMSFPNLGQQLIAFQAGSTNPYLGVALCSIAFVPGFFIYQRKRKAA